MAIATDFEPESGSNPDRHVKSSRATGTGIVTGIDRSKGIGSARRHTLRVRILRIALPITSVALVGFYPTNKSFSFKSVKIVFKTFCLAI